MVHFLIGDESAIHAIASSQSATWLALGFVLCAGLFREYDQEYVLGKPWFYLLPVFASAVLASLLFALNKMCFGLKTPGHSVLQQWRSYLTCFWMCAPMAILYAIPSEYFWDAVTATKFNLTILAIVSIWRVVLISRINSVLFGTTFKQAFFPVMLLADTLAILGLVQRNLPLIPIMGGIQYTEPQKIVIEFGMNVLILGVYSWPVWLIGVVSIAMTYKDAESKRWLQVPSSRLGVSTWGTLVCAVALMLFAMTRTQPVQQDAYGFEQLVNDENYDSAVEYVRTRERTAFPPLWNPPPDFIQSRGSEALFGLLAAANQQDTPDWFADILGSKLVQLRGWGMQAQHFWPNRDNSEIADLTKFLTEHPHWLSELNTENGTTIEDFLDHQLSRFENGSSALETNQISLESLQRLNELRLAVNKAPVEDPISERLSNLVSTASKNDYTSDTGESQDPIP